MKSNRSIVRWFPFAPIWKRWISQLWNSSFEPLPARPLVEALEPRKLYSVTAALLPTGDLLISGDAADDSLIVDQINGQLSLTDADGNEISLTDSEGQLLDPNFLHENGFTGNINIDLGEGNDWLQLKSFEDLSLKVIENSGQDTTTVGQSTETTLLKAERLEIESETIQLQQSIHANHFLKFSGETSLGQNIELQSSQLEFHGSLNGQQHQLTTLSHATRFDADATALAAWNQFALEAPESQSSPEPIVTIEGPNERSAVLSSTTPLNQFTIINGNISSTQINLNGTDLWIQGNLSSTTGPISITATGTLLITGSIDSSAAGANGEIQLIGGDCLLMEQTASVLSDGGDISLSAFDQHISMETGTSVTSTSGLVDLTAGTRIDVATISTGNTSLDAIELTASNGAITDTNAALTNLTTAGGVRLIATEGIGDGDALETDIATLAAINDTSGNIEILEADSLDIQGVFQTTDDVLITVTQGPLSVLNTGAGILTDGGSVQLTTLGAGGQLTIDQTLSTFGGDLTLNAATGIQATADSLLETARPGMPGSITINANNGDALLEGTIDASGGTTTSANRATVDVTSTNGLITINTIDASTNNPTLFAGDVNLTSDQTIEITGLINNLNTFTQTTPTSGTTTLSAVGDVFDSQPTGTVQLQTGNLVINSGGHIGSLTDLEALTGNALDVRVVGEVTQLTTTALAATTFLATDRSITLADGSTSIAGLNAGDLAIQATGDIQLGTTTDAIQTSSGDRLHLAAGRDLILQDNGLDVGTGQLFLSATDDMREQSGSRNVGDLSADLLSITSAFSGGDISFTTDVNTLRLDSTTAASHRQVTFTEVDDLTLERIRSSNQEVRLSSSTGSITVEDIVATDGLISLSALSAGGEIIDGQTQATSITASDLVLKADAGIGNLNSITTDARQLAVGTQTGVIDIAQAATPLTITTLEGCVGLENATDNITLSTQGDLLLSAAITTPTLVTLVSEGAISDSGNSVVINANSLAVDVANGFGELLQPINTTITEFAGETDQNHFALRNENVATLTIGTAGGLTGLTHTGASEGDLFVQTDGSLVVEDPIDNISGGGIGLITTDNAMWNSELTTNTPITADSNNTNGVVLLDADDDLNLNDTGSFFDIDAYEIRGNTQGTLNYGTDVILRSNTGKVTDETPLLENVVSPQVTAQGLARVLGDFGRIEEQNFQIDVLWEANDQDTQLFPLDNFVPNSFEFTNIYTANPNPNNPSAPIPILVTIYDDPLITLTEGGVDLGVDSFLTLAAVPGEGLAGGIAFDLSVEVPELEAPRVITSEAIDDTIQSSTLEQVIDLQTVVNEDSGISDEQVVILKWLNKDKTVRDSITYKGEAAESILNNIFGFFSSSDLPDGHYQLWRKAAGESAEQLILDIQLRDGRPADGSEGLLDRPPTAGTDQESPAPAKEEQLVP